MKKKRILTVILLVLAFVLGASSFWLFNKNAESKGLEAKGTESTTSETKSKSTSKIVYTKLEEGKDVKYLVVGDSIGEGVGASSESTRWHPLLNQYIFNKYKSKPEMRLLTKGGSDVFDGLVELNNYKTNTTYDLIFVCFGQNDQGSLPIDKFKENYSLLLETLIKRFPDAQIVTFVENALTKMEYKNEIQSLSSKYGAISIDMQEAFNQSGINVKELTTDGIHPNDKGYEIYARTINKVLNESEKNKDKLNEPTIKVTGPVQKMDIEVEISKNKGFMQKTIKQDNKSTDYMVSSIGKSYVEYEVQADSLLGVSIVSNTDGGEFDVYVDGKKVKTLSTFSRRSAVRHLLIDEHMGSGSHTIKFVVKNQQPSEKQDVRIAGIITK